MKMKEMNVWDTEKNIISPPVKMNKIIPSQKTKKHLSH